MRWFRRIHAVVVVATVSLISVLSLSDTIGNPLQPVLAVVSRLRQQADRGPDVDFSSWFSFPIATDTLSHFLAWCFAGTLAVGLARTNAERLNLYLSLFTFSALLEVGQRHLSMTRQAEFSDLMANGVGLIAGFVFGSFLFASLGFFIENRFVRLIPRMIRPT